MDDLYREVIIEHYKNPAYRGSLDPHDLSFEDSNPLCGDHLRIDLRVDEKGVITDARFDGHGCAISQSSADLLLESIIGKSIKDGVDSAYKIAPMGKNEFSRRYSGLWGGKGELELVYLNAMKIEATGKILLFYFLRRNETSTNVLI